MAAPNVRNILRIPGRLVASPTSLSTDYPHGGTELGVCRDMEFRFGYQTSMVQAEEFGRPIEYVYTGERSIFGAVLRTYDSAMIQRIFPNTAAGTSSGERVVNGRATGSGISRAGTLLSSLSLVLLFSPKEVDRHPSILIYNAIPAIEETSMLQLSLEEEFGLGIIFHCLPDSSGRDYSIGRREDLSL